MPTISGENLVPSGGGRAGIGAAYVLGNDNAALQILQQGERARALDRYRKQQAQIKADQENAKQFNDFAKFQQDGSPYFAEALNNQVYAPLTGQITSVFKDYKNDLFARNAAARPLLQRADNESIQSKAKTQYLTDKMRGFQGDKSLYNTEYAGQALSKALRNDDGTPRLPSQFDEEAFHNNLLGDAGLYNEGEVVKRATKGLAPTISQKIAEAGSIGGQHTADQVRGRFVAFDGKGRPVLNADGSPKLNLTADTQALLESDPLFKLKVDAREAAYNQQREADPSLPQMSRRGHIAQMVGPLAEYSTSHDESLNRLPPQTRAASGGQVLDFDESQVSPAEVGATIKGAPSEFEQALGLSQYTPTRQNFYTSRHAGAPVLIKKDGTRKPREAEALYSREVVQEDGNGNLQVTKNNKKPLSGYYGEAHQLPVNPQTGEVAFPKSKEDEQDYLRKGYTPQTYVTFYTQKNENYTADKQKYIAAELDANKQRFGAEKKSFPQIEAEAEKAASKGVSRKFVPYNAENAPTIRNQVGNYYGDFHKGTVKARAAAPAAKTKADPLNFTPAKAAPAAKSKPKANPLGF